jgi:hypothetical protein
MEFSWNWGWWNFMEFHGKFRGISWNSMNSWNFMKFGFDRVFKSFRNVWTDHSIPGKRKRKQLGCHLVIKETAISYNITICNMYYIHYVLVMYPASPE